MSRLRALILVLALVALVASLGARGALKQQQQQEEEDGPHDNERPQILEELSESLHKKLVQLLDNNKELVAKISEYLKTLPNNAQSRDEARRIVESEGRLGNSSLQLLSEHKYHFLEPLVESMLADSLLQKKRRGQEDVCDCDVYRLKSTIVKCCHSCCNPCPILNQCYNKQFCSIRPPATTKPNDKNNKKKKKTQRKIKVGRSSEAPVARKSKRDTGSDEKATRSAAADDAAGDGDDDDGVMSTKALAGREVEADEILKVKSPDENSKLIGDRMLTRDILALGQTVRLVYDGNDSKRDKLLNFLSRLPTSIELKNYKLLLEILASFGEPIRAVHMKEPGELNINSTVSAANIRRILANTVRVRTPKTKLPAKFDQLVAPIDLRPLTNNEGLLMVAGHLIRRARQRQAGCAACTALRVCQIDSKCPACKSTSGRGATSGCSSCPKECPAYPAEVGCPEEVGAGPEPSSEFVPQRTQVIRVSARTVTWMKLLEKFLARVIGHGENVNNENNSKEKDTNENGKGEGGGKAMSEEEKKKQKEKRKEALARKKKADEELYEKVLAKSIKIKEAREKRRAKRGKGEKSREVDRSAEAKSVGKGGKGGKGANETDTNSYCDGYACKFADSCGQAPLNELSLKRRSKKEEGEEEKKQIGSYMINGERQKYGEWPFYVRVLARPNFEFVCGGTLISDRHVLTAAHCMLDPRKKKIVSTDRIIAILGEDNVGKHDKYEKQLVAKNVCISDYYKARNVKEDKDDGDGREGKGDAQFNDDDNKYDFAVIELPEKVEFNDYYQPACLPDPTFDPKYGGSEDTKKNKKHLPCYLVGAGVTEYIGDMPKLSTAVEKMRMERVSCKNYRFGEKDVSRECYTKAGSVGDSCAGDSGGPILCLNPRTRRWTVAAAVSYGSSNCDGQQPYGWVGVYLRVPTVLQIIKNECDI